MKILKKIHIQGLTRFDVRISLFVRMCLKPP